MLSEKIGKMKQMRLLAVLLVPAVALIMGAVTQDVWAEEWEEAEVFFELNDTDGDLGIHAKIDGGPWKQATIIDNGEVTILNVLAQGDLQNQLVTELFFESAEPSFDELLPEEFFARFDEGTYTIEGVSEDDEPFTAETEVTQVMPAPADGITLTVSGDPIEVDLDEVDCDKNNTIPTVTGDTVTISWNQVTESHPTIGEEGDVEIFNYELVAEADLKMQGEEFTTVFSVVLPPGVTSMTIPAEFLSQSKRWKYEILAREESFNQTAVESCFKLK